MGYLKELFVVGLVHALLSWHPVILNIFEIVSYNNNHALKFWCVLNRIIKTSREVHFFTGDRPESFGGIWLNTCDWKFGQICYFALVLLIFLFDLFGYLLNFLKMFDIYRMLMNYTLRFVLLILLIVYFISAQECARSLSLLEMPVNLLQYRGSVGIFNNRNFFV